MRANSIPRTVPAAAMVLLGNVAHAEIRLHGSVGATSDYVQAGLSQTRGKPALQGGIRADVGKQWAIGVWGSQVDRTAGPGATYELDAYLARSWQLAPDWITTLTATHYFYPDDPSQFRYDYDEFTATLGFRSQVFAAVVWSPNTGDAGPGFHSPPEHTWAYELTLRQPLLRGWSADAGLGRRDMSALFGAAYWYGHAGVSFATETLSIHINYTRADDTAHHFYGADRAANTVVAAVIWKISAGP